MYSDIEQTDGQTDYFRAPEKRGLLIHTASCMCLTYAFHVRTCNKNIQMNSRIRKIITETNNSHIKCTDTYIILLHQNQVNRNANYDTKTSIYIYYYYNIIMFISITFFLSFCHT